MCFMALALEETLDLWSGKMKPFETPFAKFLLL